jgi:hypothetical protein
MLNEEYRRINNCFKNKVQAYANSTTGVIRITIGDRTIVAKDNSLVSVIGEVRKQHPGRIAQSRKQTTKFMENLNSI